MKEHANTAPNFAQVAGHKLILVEQKLDSAQMDALCTFIRRTTKVKLFPLQHEGDFALNPNVIKHLIIENCHMSDENFAKILDVVIEQRELVELRYTNNEIGP